MVIKSYDLQFIDYFTKNTGIDIESQNNPMVLSLCIYLLRMELICQFLSVIDAMIII